MKIARMLAVLVALFGLPHIACAATGFLKGEVISGLNKICTYDVLGSPYKTNIASTAVCPVTINVANPAPKPSQSNQPSPQPSQPYEPPPRAKKTGFLKGEEKAGLNKICYYDVLGDMHSFMTSATSVCPPTRQF